MKNVRQYGRPLNLAKTFVQLAAFIARFAEGGRYIVSRLAC
jgi:hypothetical protein